MKTFKVEIMPDGVTAKTVNSLGDKPFKDDIFYPASMKHQQEIIEKWQQAELERKVYEIETVKIPCMCDKSESVTMCFVCTEREYNPGEYIKPGTIVEATEINTKQIRIL